MKNQTKKPVTKKVLLAIPKPLLKRIDSAAKAQARTRTAEVCTRLSDSLKKQDEVTA